MPKGFVRAFDHTRFSHTRWFEKTPVSRMLSLLPVAAARSRNRSGVKLGSFAGAMERPTQDGSRGEQSAALAVKRQSAQMGAVRQPISPRRNCLESLAHLIKGVRSSLTHPGEPWPASHSTRHNVSDYTTRTWKRCVSVSAPHRWQSKRPSHLGFVISELLLRIRIAP